MITGTIYLCQGVPLTNTYDNTIDFSNSTEQFNYFREKVVKTIEEAQYIRKGDAITVPFVLDEIKGVNYLFYRSTNTSKWFYCFVNRKVYNDNGSTTLYIEIDVMETYMFDYHINPSYIAREHADRWDNNLDPIYSETDEGLDYGSDYITEKAYKVDKGSLMWFLVTFKNGDVFKRIFTNSSEESTQPVYVTELSTYIQVLIPLDFEAYKIGTNRTFFVTDSSGNNMFSVQDFSAFMFKMSNSAIGDYIQEITYVPYIPCTVQQDVSKITLDGRIWCTNIRYSEGENDGFDFLQVTYKGKGETLVSFPALHGVDRAKKAQWDEVKKSPLTHRYDKRFESKLLCYPYRYNLLTNWKDAPVMFKNEYLPEDVKIKMTKSFSFNAPTRYWIYNYKSEELGRSNSLVELSSLDFPVATDAYYQYMLQNKNTIQQNVNNIQIDIASGGINGMIGGASGGIVGALIGGVTSAANSAVSGTKQILSEKAKQRDIRNLPTSFINSIDSTHSIYDDNLYLTFYRYRVTNDVQDRIAWFWHMYGYRSDRVKEPDIRSRNRFNYLQTIGANVTGNMDQEDITKIQSILDRGITFWHWSKSDFRPLDYRYGNYETKLL